MQQSKKMDKISRFLLKKCNVSYTRYNLTLHFFGKNRPIFPIVLSIINSFISFVQTINLLNYFEQVNLLHITSNREYQDDNFNYNVTRRAMACATYPGRRGSSSDCPVII